MSTTIRERSEIAEKDRWALEDLYPAVQDWEKDLEKLNALIESLPSYRGKISASADLLLAYLRLNDEISVLFDSVANYAQRKTDEDTRISENQALSARVMTAYVKAGELSDFEAPEILSISDEALEGFYAQQPALRLYERYLTKLRLRRAHILDAAGEKLLASAGDMAQTPENVFSLFSDADMTFPDVEDAEGKKHPLSQGSYITLMMSPDRILRKNAFEAYYSVYQSFRNTLAATLSGNVKSLWFFTKARNYASPLERALDGTEVPVSVYHSLISSVRKNLPLMERYVALRKKLMGLDELHFYDLYAPLLPAADREIPYEETVETVCEALLPLGEDYVQMLRKGFASRWVDVYENRGKRSGAYSAGARVHPYVLLNYTGNLDGQFTVAHEMGHALHSYYSNTTQPVVYSDYVIFVAEVASTCNEALLMESLLAKTTDKKERAYLLNHFLEQFRATLFRQTMFAEFELKIADLEAQGVPLTEETLCREYRELVHDYFGDGVVLDEQIALEWARIPHFYYNFYVYQYATGYAAAIALSRKILREGKSAAEAYRSFLCGGCSTDPISLLRGAGVDMTSGEPVQAAMELFSELLDEMETLCGEL